jgi:transcriptional regulator with XRE-family HTH domain
MPRIAHLRAWRGGLSQEELALATDVPVKTIAKLENGQPTNIDVIDRLAVHFGVTRDKLQRESPLDRD